MAVKQATLKAAERRIADAVTKEVYERLSQELGVRPHRRIAVDPAAVEPMLARAIEVFGSRQVAARWFQRPNPALKMKAPSDVIASARGRKQVDAILGRIEHGVIS